jgi:hypothetical protein
MPGIVSAQAIADFPEYASGIVCPNICHGPRPVQFLKRGYDIPLQGSLRIAQDNN